MRTDGKHADLDTVLAEADKLISEIDAMVIEDFKDGQRIEIEKNCELLKNCKSKLEIKMSEASEHDEDSSLAEGFHEAYQEIVQAMKDLKTLLN